MKPTERVVRVCVGLSLIVASFVAAAHDDVKRAGLWCVAGVIFFCAGAAKDPEDPSRGARPTKAQQPTELTDTKSGKE